MKIGFIHKELVYGGAEKLILDFGLASLKTPGTSITYYTSDYKEGKTFSEFFETQNLRVKKFTFFFFTIPARLFNRFHALFNLIRMLWLTVMCLLTQRNDLYVVD